LALVLGLDEAGRGAALGPLVVAGVAIEREREGGLWAKGARDSKALSRPRRKEVLRELFCAGLRGWVMVIPPQTIDQASLTLLELGAMAEIVRKLGPDQVVLDPPVGPTALPRFLAAFCRAAGIPRERVCSFPKADAQHPVVAAASLLAKVVRDGHVAALRRLYGDFGWGYPGEGKAQEFLRRWLLAFGELPPICRRRWRSVRALLAQELHDAL
jgi:ribonuclease HII